MLGKHENGVPHTQVHRRLRQTLETTQDIIVILLMVLLIVITLQALGRLTMMAFGQNASTPQVLSQVVFALILAGVGDLSWAVMLAVGWLLLVLGLLLLAERRSGGSVPSSLDNSAD